MAAWSLIVASSCAMSSPFSLLSESWEAISSCTLVPLEMSHQIVRLDSYCTSKSIGCYTSGIEMADCSLPVCSFQAICRVRASHSWFFVLKTPLKLYRGYQYFSCREVTSILKPWAVFADSSTWTGKHSTSPIQGRSYRCRRWYLQGSS